MDINKQSLGQASGHLRSKVLAKLITLNTHGVVCECGFDQKTCLVIW